MNPLSIFTFTQSNYIYGIFQDTNVVYQLSVVFLSTSFVLIVFFIDSFLVNRILTYTKFSAVGALLFSILAFFFSNRFYYLLDYFVLLETGNLIFYIILGYKIARKDINKRKLHQEKFPFLQFLTKNRVGIILINIFILAIAIYTETFLIINYKINTPIVLIASMGFFIFIVIYIVQKMETAFINQEKVKIAHAEEKKRIIMEKEISIQNERHKVFVDIHDEVGIDLTFLGIKISQFLENKILPIIEGNELLQFVSRISASIRHKLQLLQDEKYIKDDIIFAIRLLLIRKYEYSNRDFEFKSNIHENLNDLLSVSKLESLYKIIREIANNDSKYGYGLSTWEVNHNSRELGLYLVTNSNYKSNDTDSGYGWNNILLAVKDLGGEIHSEHMDSKFKIHLVLPLR